VRVSGRTIHADAVDEDMYAAIDAMVDKLQRRVRKQKERARDHHAPEAQKRGAAVAQ
jgi:putative sigma-54 modulation protein